MHDTPDTPYDIWVAPHTVSLTYGVKVHIRQSPKMHQVYQVQKSVRKLVHLISPEMVGVYHKGVKQV